MILSPDDAERIGTGMQTWWERWCGEADRLLRTLRALPSVGYWRNPLPPLSEAPEYSLRDFPPTHPPIPPRVET